MGTKTLYERRRKSHILTDMKIRNPKTLNNSSHTISLVVDDGTKDVPIVIRKNARSRNMVMRYQPLQHHISLTLPRYVSIAQGLDFVATKRSWLEKQVQQHGQHVPLADGAIIPVLGTNYRIRHTGGRGVVHVAGDEILVPGEAAFAARRLRDWLKELLRKEIMALALLKAQALGVKFKKIGLRDTRSRWGSCSHDGNLSFSWRLVFAPRQVMEYVVCHEVAHLKHLDHSSRFWAAVEKLDATHLAQREWLRVHGPTLYTYG